MFAKWIAVFSAVAFLSTSSIAIADPGTPKRDTAEAYRGPDPAALFTWAAGTSVLAGGAWVVAGALLPGASLVGFPGAIVALATGGVVTGATVGVAVTVMTVAAPIAILAGVLAVVAGYMYLEKRAAENQAVVRARAGDPQGSNVSRGANTATGRGGSGSAPSSQPAGAGTGR